MKLVHGSLFSGFDAPSVAASWMGWENAFHCEINPFCNKILKYWFPNSEHYEDITQTGFSQWKGRIDVLTGGFPCQPFSLAGQRKGANDNRYLWPHMLRAIQEIRPTWIIGENVAGILTMVQPSKETEVGSQTSLFGEDNRKRILLRQEYVIETICKDLEREGYSVQPLLIPACAVGAPHRRDRVWLVAHRTDSRTEDVRQEQKNNVLPDKITSNTDFNRCRNRKNKQEQFTQCKGAPNNSFSGKDGTVTDTNDHGHLSCETCEESEGYRCGNNGESKKWKQSPEWSDGFHGFPWNASDPNGERCNNRSDNWKERLFYYDWKRYSKESQSEWNKWKCGTCKNSPTTSDPQCPGSGQIQQKIQSEQPDGNSINRNGFEWDVANTDSIRLQIGIFSKCNDKIGRENTNGYATEHIVNSRGTLFSTPWENFPTQSPVCRGNDGISFDVDDLTIPFTKWRQESIKGYGNAIVPQVIIEIFKAIDEIEQLK